MAQAFSREAFEAAAAEEMERMFATVSRARDFHEGDWIDERYYARHLAETVLRIRLNNEVDAYALYKIGARDNVLAARLAQYLAEEYGHEHMFSRDLKRFGISREDLDRMPTTFATDQLIGFLYLAIERDGPVPTMIWNWFVEWYSDRWNMRITRKAAEAFGENRVAGSMDHLRYDEAHDHDDLMWGTVDRVVAAWSTPEAATDYLRKFVRLIGQYFQELHDTTIGDSEGRAAA